jgi:hypothetical protein
MNSIVIKFVIKTTTTTMMRVVSSHGWSMDGASTMMRVVVSSHGWSMDENINNDAPYDG